MMSGKEKRPLISLAISTIIIIAISTSGCLELYESFQVGFVSFSPDGSKIISNDNAGVIQLWDVLTGKEIFRYEAHYGIPIFWSPDGKQFTFKCWQILRIFNSSSGKEVANISDDLYPVGWSFNGKIFVTQHESNITLWNASSFSEIKTFQLPIKPELIALSPSGEEIAYCPSNESLVAIVNISSQEIKIKLGIPMVNLTNLEACYKLCWSADGKKIALLASLNKTAYAYVWNILNSSLLCSRTINGTYGKYVRIYADFSPDCEKLVHGYYKKSDIEIINLSSGKRTLALEGCPNGTASIDWSPDGSRIAAGESYYGGMIKVWNATSGELVQTMKTPEHHTPDLNVFYVILMFIVCALLIKLKRKR